MLDMAVQQCHTGCSWQKRRAVLLLAGFLLAAAAAWLPLAAAEVLPSDKAALLAFKQGLTAEGGELLTSWVPASDPCLDAWTGVKCSCDDFFAPPAATNMSKVCTQPPSMVDGSRVLQLHFGDPRITQWNTLTGTISPSLANLSSLRVLNFEANRLYGSVPPEFARLRMLEQLQLGGNRLTGQLPAYLSAAPNLRYVTLSQNQFMGPLPLEWCSGSWWQFDVQGNAGLCDEVPTCLYSRLVSFAGTSLIDLINSLDKGNGGYCGVDPPVCDPDLGCRFLHPEPAFFTNESAVSFAFSAFQSPLGGGTVKYRWALGTTRWGRDVLDWQDFAGTNYTQNVSTPSSSVVKRVFQVDWPLNQISLTPGSQYYVTVQGSNEAGQQLGTMLSSKPIVADTTPPFLPNGASVYSGQDFTNQAVQSELSAMAASWDPFIDEETGVASYSYRVFEFVSAQGGSPGYVGPAVTSKTKLDFDPSSQGEFRVYVINLGLRDGGTYFMRIYARNGAGLEGYRDAPPVTVSSSTGGSSAAVSVSKVVILVAVFVGAASAVVALVTYWLMRESMRRHQAARQRKRGEMKNFKYLMQSLVQQTGDAEKRHLDELKQLRELAFVITDLEASTAIAAAAPRQFEKVQEMHDSLMRELIVRYQGYEINTEGDAFHVAFKDVQHAVLFCMEVQYQMLELDWPREVLRLAPCKEVKAPDGSLVYRGPRVRMGVHWAAEGTVVQRLHQITKHRVFTGPAFQVTRELCEAAHGGQVLLSHEGWVHLRQDMAAAGFPVVEQLGQFKMDSWPQPLWVYQVTQLLGRPLHRLPGPLNYLEALEAGWGMSITRPPEPRGPKGHLAFVAARLALEACVGGGTGTGEASLVVAKRLHELLATAAMQFGGYIFRLSESQAAYLLSFSSAADAVRFCHSAQALLMYSVWGPDCADFCGRTELAPDGKPVFKGPPVAMAVHQSCEFTAISVAREQAAAEDVAIDYLGMAVERVQQLSEAAHGGQVIVSEKAWAAVQDQLPGQPHVVSLGSHLLDPSPASPPLLLMEVMPQILSRRTFPPPLTLGMVEPGYRDAPGADEPVAFVYVKISKPAEVQEAEQVRPAVSDDTILRVLTAYNVALGRATKLMRQLLRQCGGYECKEPEAGKLTLAFRHLEDAIAWSCILQTELLSFAWPETVLEWGECLETRHAESTNLLWRGLRVKIGIAYGMPTSKAPLNTGRADYFGSVPNLAARLMAVAQPGQLLVDGQLASIRDLQWREDGCAVLLSQQAGAVEFTQLGYLQVKGLDDPKLVYQVLPAHLRGRQYDDLPTTRTAASSRHHSVGGGFPNPAYQSSWNVVGHLRRQASVEIASSEATPRQCSVTSIRTPSLKRGASQQPGSGGGGRLRPFLLAHSGSAVAAGGQRGSGQFSVDGLQDQFGGAGVIGDGRAHSVASSGGSALHAGWLGILGTRLSGVLGRRSSRMNEMGSPRSAGELGPLTSRSGTTCSNAPSFSAAAGGHATAVLAGSGLASGGAGGGGTHGHARSASVGFLPRGVHGCGSGVGSYVGSDSTLAAAAATHASGASTPLRGRLSGANSPPLTATRLRDAADWSYPGSTLTTPTTQAAAASSVDPWDAGLAMEAALDDGSAPEGLQPAASATAVLQPALPQRQLSGLPPRGPGHHPHHVRAFSGGSASLDPPIAAAAAGGGGGGGGGGQVSRDSSHAALLPAGRSHSSTSSIPAYLEASTLQQGSDGGAGAAHAHPHPGLVDGEQGVEHTEHAAADPAAHHSSASSEHGSIEHAAAPLSAPGGLPAWQSPARVSAMLPVPPLPLSRLGSSSSSRAGADFELAPTTSAAAPAGMQPPAAQRAYNARSGGSGTASGTAIGTASGASTARRPAGLQQLDTEVLTFETWGLESPDTITPGLQYARQVAQLFVDGRRRSSGALAASMAAAAAAAAGQPGLNSSGSGGVGGSGGTAGPSRLSQVGPVPAASGGAGAGGSSSAAQQQQQAPPWRPPNTNYS